VIDANARSGNPELDQWFTAFWAAEELVEDALRGLGVVSICEPSCGVGSFLAAVPASHPAFGVDIDARVVTAAKANSGREILVGDFRTINLGERAVELILGNPPFDMDVVDGFLDRAHQLLPEDGLAAFILPAYAFQTPRRVGRWGDHFAIDVRLIPRTIFPGISKPLVWARYTKATRRFFRGLMLFAEQRDIERMSPMFREALARPGTWRSCVCQALEALGGQASLDAIYDLITPERRVSGHWRPKVRQTLQRHFTSIERGRWAL
jgi:adenine-specific DNA-methyltransferase